LAQIAEAPGLIHDEVAQRVVPAVLGFGDFVPVGFEAVVRFGEFLLRTVGFVPFDIMDESHDRQRRMQLGDDIPEPVGK